MAVEAGDVLRATAQFTLGRGAAMQAVFHYEYSGAGDTDDEIGDEIGAQIDAAYTDLEARLDEMVQSEQMSVWKWDTALDEWNGIYQEDWTGVVGLLAGEQLPNGAAALIKPLTNLPRRQGRKFVSGLGTAMYEDTGWSISTLANLALYLADIVDSIPTDNGSLAPGVFNTVTESFAPFKNAGIVNAFASYQRRRRPGVGI